MALKNKKDKNFSEWYNEVIRKSGLADHSSVSGCLIYKPYSYAIWELIVHEMDKRFKKIGIQNTYFPIFIPEKLLAKEAEHLKGFTPEVAWVTHAGKSKLDERLAVRPTSETIMYDSYSKWIRSWRDLPLRFNQWNNVVRWEFKHPTPFIRNREFLWNEGHTIFATEKEALAEKKQIMKIYKTILEDYLALPSIINRKTESEKFAGAVFTYSFEHAMPDGKVAQGPDFHHDGQKFAKAFNITFLDKDKKRKHAWQNTWGFATREIGVLIATHGDNKGLILPPKIAPIQIVIIPIYTNETKKKVLAAAKKVKNSLGSFRVMLDDRDEYSPGWKFNEWELKGAPLRIEIGPKDLKKKQVVLARRDVDAKKTVKQTTLKKEANKILEDIQSSLFKRAEKFLKSKIKNAKNYADLKNIIKYGIAKVDWCGLDVCEAKIKSQTSAKILGTLDKKVSGKCVVCGKKAKHKVHIARTY